MFENFGVSTPTTELTKQVQTAARPNVQFANQVIEIYNSKINYAGKQTWQPMAITLRDDVTGNVSKLVGEQLQKQFDFAEQSYDGLFDEEENNSKTFDAFLNSNYDY